jgi:chemotaxis protein MotB
MFWVRKLKRPEDTDSSWVWSYSDMVTLLLAVFVMLAAMGDLKSGGERFKQISGGMRQAFGFAPLAPKPAAARLGRPPTLLERFERAGFARQSQVSLIGPDDEVLAPCDLLIDGDKVVLRIAGHASFSGNSAALQPAADKALRRVAEFLAEGSNRIEVRGHAGNDPLPVGTGFRDGMDLSYARARAVAVALVQYGVQRGRVFVTAWGDSEPLVTSTAPANFGLEAGSARAKARGSSGARDMPDGADRRIEIVVHAVSAVGHVESIAGKGH